MKHYLAVFIAIIKLSSKIYFENRWNTVGVLLNSFITLALTLIFVSIYFSYSKQIYGWSKYDVFLLIGLHRIVNSLFSFLFLRSIYHIPQYIRDGELDIFLTKPIKSQFYVSIRLMKIYELLSLISGIVLVYYVLSISHQILLLANWALLLLSLTSGLIILYSVYFSIAALSIWTVKLSSLPDVYDIMSELLSFPTDLTGKSVSLALTFIIPLGFIVTVPTKLFLGKESIYMAGLSIVFAAVFLYFSVWFWNFALRHYTSASS